MPFSDIQLGRQHDQTVGCRAAGLRVNKLVYGERLGFCMAIRPLGDVRCWKAICGCG